MHLFSRQLDKTRELKGFLPAVLSLVVALFLQECKKTPSANNGVLSEQQAAQQMAEVVSGNALGYLVSHDDSLVSVAISNFKPANCGIVIKDSIKNDTHKTYPFTGSTYHIDCFGGAAEKATVVTYWLKTFQDPTSSLQYTVALSQDSLTITNLQGSVNTWLATGLLNDSLDVSSPSSVASQYAHTLYTLTFAGLAFDPSKGYFTSGEAAFHFAGTTEQGDYKYAGSISFASNGTMNVAIIGGASHSFFQQTAKPL